MIGDELFRVVGFIKIGKGNISRVVGRYRIPFKLSRRFGGVVINYRGAFVDNREAFEGGNNICRKIAASLRCSRAKSIPSLMLGL